MLKLIFVTDEQILFRDKFGNVLFRCEKDGDLWTLFNHKTGENLNQSGPLTDIKQKAEILSLKIDSL